MDPAVPTVANEQSEQFYPKAAPKDQAYNRLDLHGQKAYSTTAFQRRVANIK
ncbi:hypothetical protein UY3_04574 [Chelonia mydas]|uniref:Uncharacterized protein n=1 Tax=Chelonia mydas TaxID=8469 RepID=M7BJY9_CHEMY|nr:hypothetical protein UY3_04574 [Chelonia mydas]